METFSALLAICAGNPLVISEFPAQRPETQSFDFSLICAWINVWVNNPEAGDLRRHGTHYGVTVNDDCENYSDVTKKIDVSVIRVHSHFASFYGHIYCHGWT